MFSVHFHRRRLPRPRLPPQKLFGIPSLITTVWAKPLIFGTKNIWVWGNVLDDLSMTLTQGQGCGVDYQKFACLRDKMRITHRITTKRGSFAALVMFITWLDFGEILLNLLFWQIFFKNFGCVFSRSKLFLPYLRNGWSNWCETKRKCIGWMLGTIYDLDLWPHSWSWSWMFQGQISKLLYLRNCWCDWCEMKRNWVNMILGG